MPMFIALLDACVLYPAALRDTLLRAALRGLYRPQWSALIIDEVSRNPREDRGRTEEQTRKLTIVMTKHFGEAAVTGYEDLITGLTCHEKDRHVLAAAITPTSPNVVYVEEQGSRQASSGERRLSPRRKRHEAIARYSPAGSRGYHTMNPEADPALYERIYAAVAQVPAGSVATYGDIAALVGGCDARTVGYALNDLPKGRQSSVPWQRIINSQGGISTRGEEQRRLLVAEGIEFDSKGRVPLARFRRPRSDQKSPPADDAPLQPRLF